MNPLFALFDLAVVALAVRSLRLVIGHGVFTPIGWGLVAVYGLAGAVRYSTMGPAHDLAARAMLPLLVAVAVAFAAGGVRDEPQAEPLLWPRRLGRTRAERRPP